MTKTNERELVVEAELDASEAELDAAFEAELDAAIKAVIAEIEAERAEEEKIDRLTRHFLGCDDQEITDTAEAIRIFTRLHQRIFGEAPEATRDRTSPPRKALPRP